MSEKWMENNLDTFLFLQCVRQVNSYTESHTMPIYDPSFLMATNL